MRQIEALDREALLRIEEAIDGRCQEAHEVAVAKEQGALVLSDDELTQEHGSLLVLPCAVLAGRAAIEMLGNDRSSERRRRGGLRKKAGGTPHDSRAEGGSSAP